MEIFTGAGPALPWLHRLATLATMHQWSESQQLAILLSHCNGAAFTALPSNPSLAEVKATLLALFPAPSSAAVKKSLYSSTMAPGQTPAAFAVQLRGLATSLPGGVPDEDLRDAFVAGLPAALQTSLSATVQRLALAGSPLSFLATVEAASAHWSSLPAAATFLVDAPILAATTSSKDAKVTCHFCGRLGHVQRDCRTMAAASEKAKETAKSGRSSKNWHRSSSVVKGGQFTNVEYVLSSAKDTPVVATTSTDTVSTIPPLPATPPVALSAHVSRDTSPPGTPSSPPSFSKVDSQQPSGALQDASPAALPTRVPTTSTAAPTTRLPAFLTSSPGPTPLASISALSDAQPPDPAPQDDSNNPALLHLPVYIGKYVVPAIVDTAASLSLLGAHVVPRSVLKQLRPWQGPQLTAANGDPLKVLGCVPVNLRLSPSSSTLLSLIPVVEGLSVPCLLGENTLHRFNALIDCGTNPAIVLPSAPSAQPKRVPLTRGPLSSLTCYTVTAPFLPQDSASADLKADGSAPLFAASSLEDASLSHLPADRAGPVHDLLQAHPSVFASAADARPASSLATHTIHVRGPPVHARRRSYSPEQRQAQEAEVQRMLALGIIRRSKSAYSSPVHMVRKKDNSWRFCVDFRELNERTAVELHPMPMVDETLHRLAKGKFFSSLDLRSGYWQLALDPASCHLTAFETESGLYEFTRLPFGLVNAPAHFQSAMEALFRSELHRFVEIYVDDIVIYSTTWEEHLEHLHRVLDLLSEHGLSLNVAKCHFARTELHYLGHVVSAQGIASDPGKIRSIQESPSPAQSKTSPSHVPVDARPPEVPTPSPAPLDATDGQWRVEKLVNKRHFKRGIQYLVRWLGFSPAEDCWLPPKDIHPGLIDEFEQNRAASAAHSLDGK